MHGHPVVTRSSVLAHPVISRIFRAPGEKRAEKTCRKNVPKKACEARSQNGYRSYDDMML